MKTKTKTVLGHVFREMDHEDWEAFAGADEGSLVCHLDDSVLVLCPDGAIVEILDSGDEWCWSSRPVVSEQERVA